MNAHAMVNPRIRLSAEQRAKVRKAIVSHDAWHVWTAENLVLGADPTFRWLRRDGFNNRLFLNQEERT